MNGKETPKLSHSNGPQKVTLLLARVSVLSESASHMRKKHCGANGS